MKRKVSKTTIMAVFNKLNDIALTANALQISYSTVQRTVRESKLKKGEYEFKLILKKDLVPDEVAVWLCEHYSSHIIEKVLECSKKQVTNMRNRVKHLIIPGVRRRSTAELNRLMMELEDENQTDPMFIAVAQARRLCQMAKTRSKRTLK